LEVVYVELGAEYSIL